MTALAGLYRQMARFRAFELAAADLWRQGRISGEMHLGTGEEALVAGLAPHLEPGDAVALDHRGTAMLLARGVDPVALLREMLGYEDGLCGGWGGHMHLFSPPHLAASSGIVGAPGPLAAGFALAATRLRPGRVAVALFGEGALNQGQLLESLNLAAAWKLPVLFVCKDNGLAITTFSARQTGGHIADRARGFGVPAEQVDGLDVLAVDAAAASAVKAVRRSSAPRLLHATVSRLDGHFLGDAVLDIATHPTSEQASATLKPALSAALTRGGGGLGARAGSMARMVRLLAAVRRDHLRSRRDPLARARKALRHAGLEAAVFDEEAASFANDVVARALGEV